MAPIREILDSDDDGDDLESIDVTLDQATEPEPVPQVPQGVQVNHDGDAPQHSTGHHSTGSTDPSFFRRVYEGQETVGGADDPAVLPTDAAVASLSSGTITSPGRRVKDKPETKGQSSLSSITDPVPGTRKAKKPKQTSLKDVDDLTQITTPRKGGTGGQTDPWAVPSSPPSTLSRIVGSATRSQTRAMKSNGKRQRAGQQSSPQDDARPDAPQMSPGGAAPDIYDFPGTASMSPIRPAKRPKRAAQSSSARQSQDPTSAFAQQTEESNNSEKRSSQRGRGTTSSIADGSSDMPATLTSLYIAPSALTASQKQEYAMVPPSSDAAGQPALNAYKSSGATTIPYPTPSRFAASSGREGLLDSAREPTSSVPQYQPSSPDILAGASARSTRSRAAQIPSSSQAESPVVSRTTRRSTKQTQDGRYSDPQGHYGNPIVLDSTQQVYEAPRGESQSTLPNTQQQHTVGDEGVSIGVDPVKDMQPSGGDSVDTTTLALQEINPPKRKRGRKRKEPVNEEEPVFRDDLDLPQKLQEIPTPAASKRGRKRKETVFEEASVLNDEDDNNFNEIVEEVPNPPLLKRGRPKRKEAPVLEDTTVEDEEDALQNYLGPVTKKRGRGRPRKSGVAAKVKTVEDNESVNHDAKHIVDSEDDGDDVVIPPKSGNKNDKGAAAFRGRKKKKKVLADNDDDFDPAAADKQQQPLADTSHNSQKSAGSLAAPDEASGLPDSETKENEQQPKQEAAKSAAASTPKFSSTTPGVIMTPAGKVGYRVGLSKRSRIAPLLKSLKK